MRRFSFAMALSLGLALTGCGPTADPAAPAADATTASAAAPPKDASPKAAAPAPGGGPGMPANVMKGMQSDSYRNQPGSQGPGQAKSPASDKKVPDAAKPADDKKAQVKLSDEEIKYIKTLPDEADQKLALAQMTCPVGGEEGDKNHLGSMGMPVKEIVKGKTVFLCCKSCVDDLKKDPDKYLSKLGK